MPITSRCRSSGRRSPPTCWRRNISARPACPRASARSRKKPCRPGCGAACPTTRRWPNCRRPSASSAKSPASRCSTGSPAPGPIGAGRAAISPPRPTRRRSSTSTATCWRCRWWHRTRRNGSTPACTGPTASTARARAISTSITRPASSSNPKPPTNIRSRTPASSSRSPTTSSTRAASWICGCARRACSNTAPAPARISPSSAAKARSCRAAAARPA